MSLAQRTATRYMLANLFSVEILSEKHLTFQNILSHKNHKSFHDTCLVIRTHVIFFFFKESSHYCNGPLKPGTEYRFKIRAYTEITKFSETRWSKSIRTDPDNTAVLVGIIIPIILLILAVIVIFAIKRLVQYKVTILSYFTNYS